MDNSENLWITSLSNRYAARHSSSCKLWGRVPYSSLVEIKRPTIAQVSDAPIGSTLEMWRNKEITTPETWVKIDRFTWRNVTTPNALLKGNRGLELSTKYKVILQLGKESKCAGAEDVQVVGVSE